MATLFFVGELREQASRPRPDIYTQERAEIELRQRQQLLHAAMIEAHKRSMIEHFPGYSINLDPRFSELTISTKVNPGSSMVLEDLAAAYEKDPARGHVSPKTKNKHDTQFRIVREFFGKHTKIDQTTREETRAFRNLLRHLPKNAQKHFPGMDVKKAAKAGARTDLPLMAPQTINDYLRALEALFRFAGNEGWLQSNPASGLLLPLDNTLLKDRRLPFDTNDPIRIFSTPFILVASTMNGVTQSLA